MRHDLSPHSLLDAHDHRALGPRLGLFHLQDEPSGTLHGLFRLRQFTQDDGHVFCAEAQIEAEAVRFCRGAAEFYRGFGFDDFAVALSTRPPERVGDDARWDRAEALLAAAAREAGLEYAVQPGEGAFYGPKLEFSLRDRLGRSWQCGTIQLDFNLPERFDLHYIDESGRRRRPAMLHRAIYGSLERFLAVVLEHYAGALPAWLAPVQVVVAPVGPDQQAAAEAAAAELRAAGIRVSLDDRRETLARRVAEAHVNGVPMFAVIGAREAASDLLALRLRDRQQVLPRGEAVAQIVRDCAPPV
jgi:threonyl-tRNA synthetase